MAIFDRDKPFLKGRMFDYILEIWERFDNTPDNTQLTAVDTKANTAITNAANAQSTANTALANAGNAQSTANTAVANAATAQAQADNADYNADMALSILAGQSDYFWGEYSFTGTPTNLVVPSWANVSSSGINYTGGFFNFSYLGRYLVLVELQGDCVNSRADWYQEITAFMRKDASAATDRLVGCTRIPPSGTWNQRFNGSALLDITSGNQWRAMINMTTNGTTSNGKLKIWIKKLV